MKGKLSKVLGQRVTSLSNLPEVDRPGSRNSVNFSRPMSPQNASPTSPMRDLPSVYSESRKVTTPMVPNNKSALTHSEIENIQHLLRETAGSPVKKKKKKIVPAVVEGSHLSNGTSGSRPTGSSLQEPPQQEPRPSSSTSAPKINNSQSGQREVQASPVTMNKMKKNDTSGSDRIAESQRTARNAYSGNGSDSDTASEQSRSSDKPRSYNKRVAGLLTKQPSIVREDREAEEEEERVNSPVGELTSSTYSETRRTRDLPTQSTSTKPVKPQSVELQPNINLQNQPSISPRTSSLAPENAFRSTTDPKRTSLSPARAAHFSAQPVLETPEGLRHQPSGRSVSPGKSALKQSPSPRGPSPIGPIPGGWTRPTPSEASDTTSVVSDDGYKGLQKKKKSARVSFDDEPVVLGRSSTPPSSLDSPTALIIQNKDNVKKDTIASTRVKKREEDNENDGVMKPVPTLPSFGSIRARKEAAGDIGNNVLESPAQSIGPSRNSENLSGTGASSDVAVSSILSRVFGNSASQNTISPSANDPLPPVVTSVEGYGDNSDTDGSVSSKEGHAVGLPQSAEDEKSSTHFKSESFANEGLVPQIAVQPATPGLDDSSKDNEGWPGMPGAFPKPSDDGGKQILTTDRDVETQGPDETPASVGISEPEPEASASYHNPSSPVVGEVAHSLRQQTTVHEADEEDDDTGDSIYSDAAEDMSEFEGDGFGSINAIVESPTVSAFSGSAPASPAVLNGPSQSSRIEGGVAEPRSDEGWDKAQAYWSGLSQSRKSQIETAVSPSAVNVTGAVIGQKSAKKKKKAAAPTPILANSQHLPTVRPLILDKEPPRTTSPLKKSMRDISPETSDTPRLRLSMRGASPKKSALRQSTRPQSTPQTSGSTESRATLQKKSRPVSAVAMVDYNNAVNGAAYTSATLNGSALTPVKAQPAKKTTNAAPAPRRMVSNGSDSSSSFKKSRPANTDSGRYTMKRSMRASSVDEGPMPATNRSSRFSVRSLSPTGSTARAPFNSAAGGMRTSMRGSADLGKDRGTKSPTRSFGFSRSSKSAPLVAKPKSRFSSRFGDSSDEETGSRSYQSRFVDSDDDDEPSVLSPGMAPVRGIPRRIDEGDSTDLEDSADEGQLQSTNIAVTSPSSRLEGAALASGSLRTNGLGQDTLQPTSMGSGLQMKKAAEKDKKKKSSFFGSLGRRKDDSKVLKADVESAARRDTPLERSKAERTLGPEIATQSPKSPKLQRRNTPKRYASDSWPLSESPVSSPVDGRPKTSDGNVAASRPGLGIRQSTVPTLPVSGAVNGTVMGKNGKKKRFPMLRKAFGLHD